MEGSNQKLNECDIEIQKCEMEIRSLEQQLVSLQKQEKDLKLTSFRFYEEVLVFWTTNISIRAKGETVSEAEVKRIKDLEADISTKEKELEKLSASSKGLEASIKALQDKIMEVGGAKMKAQKAKVDKIQEAIESNTDSITKFQVLSRFHLLVISAG